MALHIYKQNTPRIRGVLFDMDGLVLDTEKLFCRFWMEAAKHFGFPMTMDQALGMRALDHRLGAQQIHSYFGSAADYTAIRSKRIELMEAYIDVCGIELKPGIQELLAHLEAKGIPAAITSSAPKERIEKHLASVHLKHRFAAICSGHEVPRGKPEPDIYLHGAASLGLRPEECLALEDAPSGLLAACRAGCVTVMVPDLDQPDEATQRLLHAKADTLLDVISLIE